MTATAALYPAGRAARDRFVVERRAGVARAVVDPWAPARLVIEQEPDGGGGRVDVATLFLAGRECPWRCVMCDLWRHTTVADTPVGAVPAQIAAALADWRVAGEPRCPGDRRCPGDQRCAGASQIKLYNAGSFFDPRAVPPADDAAIAREVERFARVIVEAHPALIAERTWAFRDRVASLEVAIGLETAHPEALASLNKGFGVDGFARAADALAAHRVALRVFLLVHPPFIARAAQADWLARSIELAIASGATAVALIPTRGGNGAMEALAAAGLFAPPDLVALEAAAALGIREAAGRTRVLVDLWDIDALHGAGCDACREPRRARLLALNLTQAVPPAVTCAGCGATSPA